VGDLFPSDTPDSSKTSRKIKLPCLSIFFDCGTSIKFGKDALSQNVFQEWLSKQAQRICELGFIHPF
jgi:hypothetical protein